jgi:hypothetical protein
MELIFIFILNTDIDYNKNKHESINIDKYIKIKNTELKLNNEYNEYFLNINSSSSNIVSTISIDNNKYLICDYKDIYILEFLPKLNIYI